VALNKPGNFSFNLPITTNSSAYLNPVEYCVIVVKNGDPIWAGPLWTKEIDFDSGKINLSAVGWFELLNKRHLFWPLSYTNQTDGYIVTALLNAANDNEYGLGVYNPPDPVDTHILPLADGTSQLRTINYEQFQNIGEAITNLTAVENGLDFKISPVSRQMSLLAPENYDDNGLIFAAGWGPDNITGVNFQVNGDDLANKYFVTGATSTAEANNSGSIDQYGLHTKIINLGEVEDTDFLGYVANAELAITQEPRLVTTFAPKPQSVDHPEYPSAFEDYNVGDKVYLTAHKLGFEVNNLGLRIFGFTVTIDENNNERVTSVQTTYQAT
jgi:hypothetical protein